MLSVILPVRFFAAREDYGHRSFDRNVRVHGRGRAGGKGSGALSRNCPERLPTPYRGRSSNGYDGLPRRRSDQRQGDGHRGLNPESTTGVCDISADNLGKECALRTFRQTSFARNGTFEHTFGQTQAISSCVTAERRYAAGMEARRRSRARVKWEI